MLLVCPCPQQVVLPCRHPQLPASTPSTYGPLNRACLHQDGEWVLCQPGAGAVLTSGTSSASLKNLVLRPLPPVAPLANLGGQLFGHLPDLPPDGAAAAAVPLLQVACVALEGGGGGGVLGLRLSHMIGDFGTLRALLHHLARAYSGRPLAPADLPVPAAALVEALASVPPPPGAQPWNYVPLLPRIGEMFGPLLAAPPLQGLVLHVPPARLAALKAAASSEAAAAAAAEAAAAGTDGGGGGGDAPQPAWVSTNNALTAWLWRTLATLPCHRGEVSAFYQALGMRGRLPAAAYAGSQAPKPPRWIYGNLAGSAYTPEMDVAEMPLGAVALALRRTIHRCLGSGVMQGGWCEVGAAGWLESSAAAGQLAWWVLFPVSGTR